MAVPHNMIGIGDVVYLTNQGMKLGPLLVVDVDTTSGSCVVAWRNPFGKVQELIIPPNGPIFKPTQARGHKPQ